MSGTLILDPASVANNRTALNLNTGPIRVDTPGIDWGDAAITAYMAGMKIGSAPVDFVLPNRMVRIPLFVFDAEGGTSAFLAAAAALRQKVALFQREGGWLQRSDTPLYVDVVNATLVFPDQWGERGNFENGIVLTLECLPDFYGAEVTLNPEYGTGLVRNILTSGAVTNLVPNPSFEYDTVGAAPALWAPTIQENNPGAALTTQPAGGMQGAHYMKVTTISTVSTGAEILLPGPFLVGQPYTLTLYAQGAVGGESFYCGLGNSTDLAQTTVSMGVSWTKYTVTWTPTANRVNAVVFTGHQPATVVSYYIDAVQVTTGAAALPYSDGDSPGAYWTGTAGQSVSKYLPTANIVTNPNFEYDTTGAAPSGWGGIARGPIGSGTATLTASTAQAHSGTKSMSVTNPGAANAQGASIPLGALNSGQVVTAAVWVRPPTTQNMTIAMEDNTQGNGIVISTVSCPANTWTQLSVSWTPSAYSANAMLYVYPSTVFTAQTFFVDDAIVMAGASVPTYVDGDSPGYTWTSTPGNSISRPNALVTGDHPGRCRIIASDTSANDQQGLIWGFRSKNYDSASTAALRYLATAMTGVNGCASAAVGGASSGNAMQATMPTGVVNSWVAILTTTLASGSAQLTHVGSYRVWARVNSNSATQKIRLLWQGGTLTTPTTNPEALVPGSGNWYLMDLGVIRFDKPPVGTWAWQGVLQMFGSATDVMSIDQVFFQPLDESAGILQANTTPATAAVIGGTPRLPTTAADGGGAGPAWNTLTTTGGTIGDQSGALVEGDNNWANCRFGPASTSSNALLLTNFGFSLPTGATVAGIQVELKEQTQGSDGWAQEASVQIIQGGTAGGTDHSRGVDLPYNVWSWVAYGGPSDLWGLTWTPTQINASNFGVSFKCGSHVGSANAMVDAARITVYFTLAGGFTVGPDAVMHASRTVEMRTEGMYRSDTVGVVYGTVGVVEGDLPRIPPSGYENRPVELFVKPSRGDTESLPDAGLDGASVVVKYRPSFLFPSV